MRSGEFVQPFCAGTEICVFLDQFLLCLENLSIDVSCVRDGVDSVRIVLGFLIVVAGPIIAIFIGAIISFVVVAYLVKEYLDETARAKQRKKKSTPPPQ